MASAYWRASSSRAAEHRRRRARPRAQCCNRCRCPRWRARPSRSRSRSASATRRCRPHSLGRTPLRLIFVIVESPAKARTIAGFLGDGYVVKASMGHIRDLPAKGLQVDVENDFRVEYEVHASKKDVINDLKRALKDADELYLATDEDREGEAISWHLLEVLKPTDPGEADGLPRDHPLRHRGCRRQLARPRPRSRRRPGEPPHRRPPVRLPGVRGRLAQDPPGSVGRAGPVAGRPARRRPRARAHGLPRGVVLGPRRHLPDRPRLQRRAGGRR